MSCRSQSDEYKSALTYRFTTGGRFKLQRVLENLKSPGQLKSFLTQRKSTRTKDISMYLRGSNPFDLHNAEVLKHQPLQDPSTQLRYLYLLPRTHNIDFHGQTVVRCELLSDVEEQAPRYIGLSYTWGDPQIRRPIIVGDKIFQATANLAIALEHLQDDKKTIIFWIDAICIDQSNLNEKSIQVQRMGHIFASAALVIAWLGPAADESELALRELMRYNNDKPDSYEDLKHTFRKRYAALPIESINAFFDRQWFKRVWVGQEVALSKHVTFVCGQLEIQREELLACFWTFVFSRSLLEQTKLSARNTRFIAIRPLPLRDFLLHDSASLHLCLGSDLESSDPRDFIYSSLGRISSLGECVLDVDYTKRVQDVYTEFAVAAIRVGEVDWLSEHWRPSVNYEDLPSWVPDWSSTEPCRGPRDDVVLEYNIAEVCEIERGGKALNISARRITQISSTNCSLSSQQETFAFDLSTSAVATQQEEERVMSSLDTVRQALDDKERWSHEDAERAAYDLSSGMSLLRQLGYDGEAWEGDLYDSYKAFRGLQTLPSDVADPKQWRRDASRAYLRVLQDSNVKNFFVTATDIVGTSRDEVQLGDWVCALGGVEGVHVLREVEGGFYRIVSFANVFPWEDVEYSDGPVETITII